MKNIICIIARTNSKRLEKKVLKEINGISMIEYIIGKMKKSKFASEIYICTSNDTEDSVLENVAKKNGVKFYAGHPDAPIERMMSVAEIENADHVVRITGDNIFTDEVYLDLMFKYHIENKSDYTRTEFLPVGVTAEVIKVEALKKCFEMMPIEFSEYLLMYMFQPQNFNCLVLVPCEKHRNPNWSLTVDNADDWERTVEIIGKNRFLNYDEIVEICNSRKISNLNYNPTGLVKMPANFYIYFKTFRTEMDLRVESSQRIDISIDEYYNIKNEQGI